MSRAGRPRFSNVWKKAGHFFQTLEKTREIFPNIGKNRREFSNVWKTPAPAPGGRPRFPLATLGGKGYSFPRFFQ